MNASSRLSAALVVLSACLAGCLGERPELLTADASADDVTTAVSPENDATVEADLEATASDDASPDDGGGSDDGGSEAGPLEASVDAAPECLEGGACTLSECQLGAYACSASGTQTCASRGNVTNGTACDAGSDASAVCGGGSCGACNAGADCTAAGSCQKMSIVCTSGSPVCTAAGTVADGTACGTNLFCNKGQCAACTVGAGCVPADNACNVGKVACTAGQVVCTDQQTAAPNGTACGTNQVCDNGACTACTANVVCTPAGNACHTGLTSCTTGTSVCVDKGAGQDGTACTSTNGCDQTYTCQAGACTGSNPVSCPAIDACHTAGVCTSTGPTSHTCSTPAAANGSGCGTNMACSGGVCGCASGFSSCSGACVNEQIDPNNCGGCGTVCGVSCSSAGCLNALQVAVGETSACAFVTDGTIRCWGANYDGTTNVSPTIVPGLTHPNAVALSNSGSYDACVLADNGAVSCWGYNADGELGNGGTTSTSTPQAVSGLTASSISVNGNVACAVESNGTVECWGYKAVNGVSASTPQPIPGLGSASAVSVGASHVCALMTDGTVECWGSNAFGQLGNGTSNSTTPLKVAGVTGATGLAAGGWHTCALVAGGAVMCWGENDYGQLGNGTIDANDDAHPTATMVSNLSNATKISAGQTNTCAVAGTSVECWGYDQDGEVGNAMTGNPVDVPAIVSGVTNAINVSVGDQSACALTANPFKVFCWGSGAGYELGTGTTASSSVAVPVKW